METPETAKLPVTQGFLIGVLLASTRAAMCGLGNRLKVGTARHSWGLLLQRTTDRMPIAMRRNVSLFCRYIHNLDIFLPYFRHDCGFWQPEFSFSPFFMR